MAEKTTEKKSWRKARNKEGRMTIWEHLGELRHRLTIIVVALLVATAVLYFVAPYLIFFLIQPVLEWITDVPIESIDDLSVALIVRTPLGGFSLRFFVAIFFAVLFTSPIWIWQLMAFFLPALKPNERKWVLPTFFAGLTLFIVGLVFCYFVILDPAFAWLLGQTKDFALVLADANEYLPLIMLFEIAFGFAFQLPLIVFYLLIFNIIPYKKLRKNWRIVYVVLLVFCAMVTPDASPVTMILMFVAMAGLYEVALALSRIVLRKRIKAKEAEDAAEEAREAEAEAKADA